MGATAYGLLAYSLSRDMDSALNGVAEVLAERARVEGSAFLSSDVDELFRRFFGFSPLHRHFEMFDPPGRRDPRQPQPRSSKLPLSPKALKNASQGLRTFETVEDTGPYPTRILTLPVLETGRVTNLVQVELSLENMYKTRRRFLLITRAVLPLIRF